MPQDQNQQQTPPSSVEQPITPVVVHSSKLWSVLAGLVFVVLVAFGIYWFSPAPEAANVLTQPKKIGTVHFKQGASSVEGLKRELAALGYTNLEYVGKEILPTPSMITEIRSELTRLIQEEKIDLFFADHEQQAKTAVDLTKELGVDIPIVFITRFHDPVRYGIVNDFRSSGNNATGIVQNLTEVSARIYEFLRGMNPELKKVGVFGKGFMIPGVADDEYFVEMKREGERLGIEVVEFTTDAPPPQAEAEFNRLAEGLKPGDIDGLFHLPGHFFETQESAEYELARALHIPHHAPYEDMPGGGHFAYSSNFEAAGEQAARLVDKIFRGATPSQVPVEFGEQNHLVLDIARARESEVTFSDSMLFIASERRGE